MGCLCRWERRLGRRHTRSIMVIVFMRMRRCMTLFGFPGRGRNRGCFGCQRKSHGNGNVEGVDDGAHKEELAKVLESRNLSTVTTLEIPVIWSWETCVSGTILCCH